MYLPYANLVHFTSLPTYSNMYEAKLKERVLDWVGEAQELLNKDYFFTVDFEYSELGVAIDASIRVQRKTDGVWEDLGTYSVDSEITLSSVISTSDCEAFSECVPSDIISAPIHYYAPGYYQTGYYV